MACLNELSERVTKMESMLSGRMTRMESMLTSICEQLANPPRGQPRGIKSMPGRFREADGGKHRAREEAQDGGQEHLNYAA